MGRDHRSNSSDSMLQYINIVTPNQEGHHCAEDIVSCILFNGKSFIFLRISPKFMCKDSFRTESTLDAEYDARHHQIKYDLFTGAYIRHQVSMS